MWLAIIAGALTGLSVFLLVAWWRAWPLLPEPNALRPGRLARVPRRTWILLGVSAGGAVIVWAITGWLLALVAIPAAATGLPILLSGREGTDRIARLEAMGEWTRSLAGVLTVGIGFEEALMISQRSVPAVIAEPVARLAARLDARSDTVTAIRAFASDLNDPTGDLIAINLRLAARRRGTGLATVLEALAESVAADVRARREVEADRAKSRATARWVTIITVCALAPLAFAGDYVAPYGTPIGQIVLVVLLSAYVGALVWMKHIATGKPPARSLGAPVLSERNRRMHAAPQVPLTQPTPAWGGTP
jgi:tight adherence protein B